jgi:hypothetical protein
LVRVELSVVDKGSPKSQKKELPVKGVLVFVN